MRRRPSGEQADGAGAAERPNNIDLLADDECRLLAQRYLERFRLVGERLWITTERPAFEVRLGRRVSAAIGGAYVYHRGLKTHLILINLARIDRAQPRALEVVVAEEFLHMRDWID
jgi:hypothetical protein